MKLGSLRFVLLVSFVVNKIFKRSCIGLLLSGTHLRSAVDRAQRASMTSAVFDRCQNLRGDPVDRGVFSPSDDLKL